MAATRLRKLLPKLERVELRGSHCFYPSVDDANELRSEVRFLANSVESIWKAFRYVDVVVQPLVYRLVLVFSGEVTAQANIEDLLRKSFGNESQIRARNETHFTVINDGHNNHLDIRVDVVTDLEAVRTRSKLTHGRSNLTVAEREFYKVPGSGFYEQVFIPGRKLLYRTIYSPLYLEEFIDKVNVREQPTLEKLTLNLLIYPVANQTDPEIEESYARAVRALHKAAPNLGHVDIMGGHALMRENGTAADVDAELHLIKTGLDALARAFERENLTLHSVIMQVFLIFPEEAFVDYDSKVEAVFRNNTANPRHRYTKISSHPNLTLIHQQFEGEMEFRLELSTTSDVGAVRRLKYPLEEGYSDDFTGASILHGFNMSYIKGDLHLHDW